MHRLCLRHIALAISLAVLFTFGCSNIADRRKASGIEPATKDEIADLAGERLDSRRLRTATHAEIERLGLKHGEYALRVNRTLIYPCQWLRADELAQTLQPLIQTQYGSNAVIIPHAETNHLFIYIPPLHERENSRRRATPQGGVSSPRVPVSR